MKFLSNTLICVLALASFLFSPSCSSTGGAPPIVGFATFQGNGDVRTDGNVWMAVGNARGEAGLFFKGSGFPLTQPFRVEPNFAYIRNRALNVEAMFPLYEPLPAWCESLFRPGEVEQLSADLGYAITFQAAQ